MTSSFTFTALSCSTPCLASSAAAIASIDFVRLHRYGPGSGFLMRPSLLPSVPIFPGNRRRSRLHHLELCGILSRRGLLVDGDIFTLPDTTIITTTSSMFPRSVPGTHSSTTTTVTTTQVAAAAAAAGSRTTGDFTRPSY